jgi:hypothetical protein
MKRRAVEGPPPRQDGFADGENWMKIELTAVLWLLFAAVGAAAQPSGNAPTPAAAGLPDYVIEPRRLSAAPSLDGRLDDPVWRQATLLTSFTQYEPNAGQPVSERTELRVGYDSENLYLGFRCFDSQPGRIVASTMTRDTDLTFEDSVQVYLDTFHDRSNAFMFAVNSLGARYDALVRREGEEINVYWDGLWRVATSRDERGWVAEIAIPFKTLRFPGSETQIWGFNARRLIPRKGESAFWKPVPRANGVLGPYKVSAYGELRGLSGLTSSGRSQLVPYGLTRDRREQAGTGVQGNAGGDFKLSLTSNLTADLTFRTDFAEAEADLQQINFSRYKLLYPEKRAFFLEGANLFYFGDRGAIFETNEHFNFFFSRQIGLTPDGVREVPVLGGGKLSGRVGDLGVGVLNLTSEPLRFLDSQGRQTLQPRTNYSVVRLKEDIFANSSVGLIALDKDATGDRNQGLGFDWNLNLAPHLYSAGFLAKTRTPGLSGGDNAGSADLLYQSGVVRAWTEYAEYGKNFNPELGFLTRAGIKKSQSGLYVFLHPDWWEIHRLTVSSDFDHVTDSAGHPLSQIWRNELIFVGTNGTGLAVIATDDLEVLDTPFAVHKGVTLPVGVYRFRDIFLGFGTDYSKALGTTLYFDYGDYYDGTRLRTLASVVIHPRPGLQADFTWDRSNVSLKEGRFITDLIYSDLVFSFTSNLFVRTLVQWNKVDNFRVNAMIDWTYRPGSDFYLVYNDVRDLDPERRLLAFSPVLPGRSLTAKMVYRLDF